MFVQKNTNPFRFNNTIPINFKAKSQETENTSLRKSPISLLPRIQIPTPHSERPVNLPGVPYKMARTIIYNANASRKPVGVYLAQYLPLERVGVKPEPSVTAEVGRTNITTLIDSQQIFNKTTEFIKSAKNTIQIEMFEFGNMDVDSHRWSSGGAESVEGWQQQQQLLKLLKEKNKQFKEYNEKNPNKPKKRIQVILDTHKWNLKNGNGDKNRFYSNMEMIRELREEGIDVVPYPRSHQQGTNLQHVKFLAVDGKKAILGGMNWGNHSPANHDACIAIETRQGAKNSEVDNLIMQTFNSDWAFAWERLGKTELVRGPLKVEDQWAHGGINRQIKAENIEYMMLVGELYDNPTDRSRYRKKTEKKAENPDGIQLTPSLDLPEVKPVKDPKIKILTNLPREYSYIGSEGSESIGKYIRERIDTANSLKAELFALTHFEIALKIIERYEENKKYKETNGKEGRPFDVQIIVDPGILDDFPYCRKVYDALRLEGVPIRKYKVNKKIDQKLHSKWAVFDEKEVLIGSANWSAVGLETNLSAGKRKDYPKYNQMIDDEIDNSFKTPVQETEEKFGLSSIFDENGTVIYDKLKSRKNSIKNETKKLTASDDDPPTVSIKTVFSSENITDKDIEQGAEDKKPEETQETEITKIELTEKNLHQLQRLHAMYKEVKELLNRKKTYVRGNHECAVAVENKDIADTFLKQFKKDWDYSDHRYKFLHKPGEGRKLLLTLRGSREPDLN